MVLAQSTVVFGQILADTSFVSIAEKNARSIYKERMKDHVHLFEGKDYKFYESDNDQHPYFNPDWSVGSVFYNGSLFTNEEILYITYKDEVVIQDFYGANFIQLIAEKVDYFTLDGHTFVYITDPSVKSGFYDLLVDGEIKAYAKRGKEFKENISSAGIEVEFRETNKYFIFRNNKFYPVKGKRSVRLVLSDHEAAVKQFIRSEKLQFRKKSVENTIVRITQYCNGL